jgi:hypothetical protein
VVKTIRELLSKVTSSIKRDSRRIVDDTGENQIASFVTHEDAKLYMRMRNEIEILLAMEDHLQYLYGVFADSRFTDHYDDAGAIKNLLTALREARKEIDSVDVSENP